jgi:hypothetical protein
MPESRLITFVVEFKEALLAIVLFAIGFNLIELTTYLFLDAYPVQFADYTVATVGALLVGKAVLVANGLPFFRRFDTAPLIRPILFKTFLYWSVVAWMRFLERVIEYRMGGGRLGGVREYVAVQFAWHRFFGVQIRIFTPFLIYTTATEPSALFDESELTRSIFTRSLSQ